ncbi:MAG: glycosyltransferase [Muribaculaceae bacterium]|nr:glycosyltransferase [Muribaculaceae bacterium]
MKNYIIVNATALESGGGLSILQQFIENVPSDDRKWLIFVSPEVSVQSPQFNVFIEPIHGVKSLPKRLYWDTFGLKKWLKRHEIDPVASVSLQNTGFNVGKKVPSFIYYHQSLPFYPYRWNPFKKNERTFWFYKNIYPIFVKLFLRKDTYVFVQLEYIKQEFSKYFKHPLKKIGIFLPSVKLSYCKNEKLDEMIDNDTIKLFYPASANFYKNHRVIIDALKFAKDNVSVIFTIDHDEQYSDDRRIKYIGSQSFETICNLYKSCDALVFPSYIETFGLPLLEAAVCGLPIIAADLPYAREVLSGYEGATFVPFDDPKAWHEAIKKIEKRKRYKPIDIESRPGWYELFQTIVWK